MKLLAFLFGALLSLNCLAGEIVLTEHNSVSINQPITSKFIAQKNLEVLGKALRLRPGSDFYLVLNTPGGEVFSGMLFVDTLNSLNIKVHTITIFAASMGYQFAQHLGKRYILPSGVLMSHRASVGGVGGQINGELNARTQFLTDVSNRIDKVTAKRVGLSLEAYQKLIVNELWLTSDQAVATGHADEIANVKCSNSLLSKKTESIVETFFGNFKVTFSACPLIAAPIEVKADNARAVSRIQEFYSDMRKFVNERL